MSTTSFVGGTPAKVQKVILSERSPLTLPPNTVVLHSEVVMNDDDDELLELWLAVPTVASPDTADHAPNEPKTIYTNTVVHDEDTKNFQAEVEQEVAKALDEYGTYEDDDEWHN